MPSMAEMIRQHAVPEDVMRSAASGALALPPSEMIEVLVVLADHPQLGPVAHERLLRWDTEQLRTVVQDAATPKPVLHYFLQRSNRHAELMMPLISNPAVTDATLAVLAETANRSLLQGILVHERALASPEIMIGIAANPELDASELQSLRDHLK